MALRNVTIFLGAPEAQPELCRLASRLGATVVGSQESAAEQGAVNVIVSDTTLAPWFLGVMGANPDAVVVKQSWLQACAEARRKVPHAEHQLQPLEGCKVCLTGVLDLSQRDQLAAQVRAAGGHYSADLLKDVTHLVAASSSMSPKLRYAMTWGINVVSLAWIDACVKAGRRQPEADFAILSAAQLHGTSSNSTVNATATAAQPQPPTLPASAAATVASQQHRQADTAGTSSPRASAGQPPPQPRKPAAAHAAEPTKLDRSAAAATASAAAPGAAGGKAIPTVAAAADAVRRPHGLGGPGSAAAGLARGAEEADVLGELALAPREPHPLDDDWLFMDWVRLHCVGLGDDEAAEVRRLVAHGGAVREPSLAPRVTHVLVGSRPAAADLAAVRAHALSWKEHVRVVRLAWLEQSVAQRCCLEPVEPSLLYPLGHSAGALAARAAGAADGGLGLSRAASLQDGGAAAPAGPPAGLLLPVSTASVDFFDLAGQQDARSRAAAGGELLLPGGGGAAGGAAGGQPLDLSQGLALPREPGKALEGLWFTLAALPQDKELMALIRSNGGLIFTADSMRKVRDAAHAFALCPPALSPPAAQDLERAAADFRMTPPGQRVTALWLQESLRVGRLLDPSLPSHPVLRPLPLDVPLHPFPQQQFHVAGFKNSAGLNIKKVVIKVLEVLGAEVTQALTAHNTHLVLPEAGGSKYNMACKYGMVTVNEHWVLHVARTGRPPDPWEHRFRPLSEAKEQREHAQRQHRQRPQLLAAYAQQLQHHEQQQQQQGGLAMLPPAAPPAGRQRSGGAGGLRGSGGSSGGAAAGSGEGGAALQGLMTQLGPTQFAATQQLASMPPPQAAAAMASQPGGDGRRAPAADGRRRRAADGEGAARPPPPDAAAAPPVACKTVSYNEATGFRLLSNPSPPAAAAAPPPPQPAPEQQPPAPPAAAPPQPPAASPPQARRPATASRLMAMIIGDDDDSITPERGLQNAAPAPQPPPQQPPQAAAAHREQPAESLPPPPQQQQQQQQQPAVAVVVDASLAAVLPEDETSRLEPPAPLQGKGAAPLALPPPPARLLPPRGKGAAATAAAAAAGTAAAAGRGQGGERAAAAARRQQVAEQNHLESGAGLQAGAAGGGRAAHGAGMPPPQQQQPPQGQGAMVVDGPGGAVGAGAAAAQDVEMAAAGAAAAAAAAVPAAEERGCTQAAAAPAPFSSRRPPLGGAAAVASLGGLGRFGLASQSLLLQGSQALTDGTAAGEEELADLQTSIQALIQTHKPRLPVITDLAFTQEGGPAGGAGQAVAAFADLLPPGAAGLLLGRDVEASRSSGGAGTTASGLPGGSTGQVGGAGDASSKLRPRRPASKRQQQLGAGLLGGGVEGVSVKAARTSAARRRGAGADAHEGLLGEEMSQQVGYDTGPQRADERLLRSRGSGAAAPAPAGQAPPAPAPSKEDFVSRVLRQRRQNPPANGTAAGR